MRTYEQKLARVLDAMGGLYLVDDILTAIGEGRMQSLAVNNSWAILEAQKFPRAKKLNVLAVIGDMSDMQELHDRVLNYARGNGFGLVSAYGRKGWIPNAEANGWRTVAKSFLYQRDL